MIKIKEGSTEDKSNYNVGHSDDSIEYPGVYTCATVTGVLSDGGLVGTHLACRMSQEKIDQSLKHLLSLAKDKKILTVYIVGVMKYWALNSHFNQAPEIYRWPIMPHSVKTILDNHKGNTWLYDTSHLRDVSNSSRVIDIKVKSTKTAGAFIDLKYDGIIQELKVRDFVAI